jgi:hypothetical protein
MTLGLIFLIKFFAEHSQLLISVRIRIRIQGAKPMRPYVDPDRDPGQTLESRKVEVLCENILKVSNMSKNIPTKVQQQSLFERQRNQVYLLVFVIFRAPDPHCQ